MSTGHVSRHHRGPIQGAIFRSAGIAHRRCTAAYIIDVHVGVCSLEPYSSLVTSSLPPSLHAAEDAGRVSSRAFMLHSRVLTRVSTRGLSYPCIPLAHCVQTKCQQHSQSLQGQPGTVSLLKRGCPSQDAPLSDVKALVVHDESTGSSSPRS